MPFLWTLFTSRGTAEKIKTGICENRLTAPLPRFDHMPLAVMPVPFDHKDWLFEIRRI